MIEQQDRRYKGYLMILINKQVLLKYKNQLDNKEFDMSNIYNEYEYLSMKISFDKNLISPQTDFMNDFINLLNKENFKSGMKVKISDFSEKGEGEKKIVVHIKKHCSQNDQIIIYSPDADMIIMTMILKYNIFIFYDL
jgi:5'-3' exonuclease